MADIKFYNLPYHICSCRDEYGNPTRIARRYKEYFEEIKNGKEPIDILNSMKILRMCCRKRFLAIPVIPMIDRNRDRLYNDINTRNIISENTRELKPKISPPDFPLLSN